MINEKLIIDLISSSKLKDAIKKENTQFNEYELYKIAYLSTKSVEGRIKWSKYFKDNCLDDEVKEIATKLYNHLVINFNSFKNLKDNEFYNLIIKYKNNIVEDIKSNDFNEIINKTSQIVLCNYVDDGYRINDLDISIYKKDSDDGDYISVVFMNRSLEFDNLFFGYDSKLFENPLIDDITDYYSWPNIKFPSFFKHGDLVVLNGDINDLSIDNIGVIRNDTEDYYKNKYYESVAYVIPLNNSYVLERKMDELDEYGSSKGLNYHKHIPFIDLNIIDASSLDDKVKEEYEYFIRFLKRG